ncbi:hypothetical protein PRIPAC_70106 [Pristionchus pacificus]|uniref:Uncharacterized protein n=1 Tax=Pristionchus pacificus TaxID=54126 RepID=A0A2A6CFH6_PRIPA|nr:hypothetical protein PRIPAC_70106 [Pristionchus pacificus]|eukprot:PDM76964.1 hypothetical protein PRIPAC_42359 [Pristionchus pacificus]
MLSKLNVMLRVLHQIPRGVVEAPWSVVRVYKIPVLPSLIALVASSLVAESLVSSSASTIPPLSSLGISGGRGESLPRIALAARDASMTSPPSSLRQLRQGRSHLHWIPDEERDRRVKGTRILLVASLLLMVTHSGASLCFSTWLFSASPVHRPFNILETNKLFYEEYLNEIKD